MSYGFDDDEFHSVYLMQIGENVIIGRSKTPLKAIARWTRENRNLPKSHLKSEVFWFSDESAAGRTYNQLCMFIAKTGHKPAGDLRSPHYQICFNLMSKAVSLSARKAGVKRLTDKAVLNDKAWSRSRRSRRLKL